VSQDEDLCTTVFVSTPAGEVLVYRPHHRTLHLRPDGARTLARSLREHRDRLDLAAALDDAADRLEGQWLTITEAGGQS
jgi:hypothetical protein